MSGKSKEGEGEEDQFQSGQGWDWINDLVKDDDQKKDSSSGSSTVDPTVLDSSQTELAEDEVKRPSQPRNDCIRNRRGEPVAWPCIGKGCGEGLQEGYYQCSVCQWLFFARNIESHEKACKGRQPPPTLSDELRKKYAEPNPHQNDENLKSQCELSLFGASVDEMCGIVEAFKPKPNSSDFPVVGSSRSLISRKGYPIAWFCMGDGVREGLFMCYTCNKLIPACVFDQHVYDCNRF